MTFRMTEMRSFLRCGAVMLAVAVSGCAKQDIVPETLSYEVVSVVPHDADAYTQGLQLKDGRLLESTGHYSKSSVREVDLKTGAVLKRRSLPAEVFGEGLTMLDGELWVLTWKEKTAYVLDPASFRTLRTHSFGGEGWGLTTDGKHLIMSDGSDTLKFRDPKDMAVKKTVAVTERGRPVKLLNELEYIGGSVFANVYMTNRIARIDPESGQVTGWLDLSALRSQLPAPNRAEVLNGIAHDGETGHLLVTGKYWPRMFTIKLKP
ncbi:MAG: glutaminyl-peptide cyclotransferase [Verrucomicrobiaceae bacterium]|nr:MAG: glutaminyl-peptide cyclotransferase [Verrucomicrobiaceae bacterium]